MATYHVRHRFGFVADYNNTDKVVIDCRDAVIYSRIGAIRIAEQLNAHMGECDRKAVAVMLTSTSKVWLVHGVA